MSQHGRFDLAPPTGCGKQHFTDLRTIYNSAGFVLSAANFSVVRSTFVGFSGRMLAVLTAHRYLLVASRNVAVSVLLAAAIGRVF